MIFEIRKTKAAATCGGSRSKCDTYKDHPEYKTLRTQDRNIPRGEYAYFIDYGDRGYCLCYKHAPAAIQEIKDQIIAAETKAKELGW